MRVADALGPPSADAPQEVAAAVRREYGTIVVVGGGCYGSYYVRQLTRAAEAGALRFDRLVVVDRDAQCRVSRAREAVVQATSAEPTLDSLDAGPPPRRESGERWAIERHHWNAVVMEIAEWGEFFRRYLDAGAADPAAVASDAIVPSPLMPHLMYEWLLERVRARWPERDVRTVPLDAAPNTPWQRGSPDGSHFVSFAEWMCPINCVEPALCPEIRGPRSWSMPRAVRDYAEAERGRGRPLVGPLLLRCVHRAYGVGMFDTSEVLDADREVASLSQDTTNAVRAQRVLVATVSHCHGALNLLEIGAA
jgi:hypothetical protein